MVGHQTPCPDRYAELRRIFPQKRKIAAVILVTEEYRLTAIPPLRDVMRNRRNNDASDTSYGKALRHSEDTVN